MIDTIISAGKKTDGADVVIVSAAYEKTASSRKGTINGPKAILKILNQKLEFFDRKFKCEPNKILKIAEKDLGNISSKTPEKALEVIVKGCEKFVEKDQFVLLLGGEHSVSLGLFKALAKKHNPKDVTIVQIDAHCDLRDNDGDYNPSKPSKLAHSCVLHRGNELGYNLVQVGIRTYDKTEYEYFSDPKNNITVFEWGASKKIPTIAEILASIKTEKVYITIDVDGFDPSFMPGTGTPVQGGLEWWYGMELVETLATKKNLIGLDIVEVSPQKETVLTEYGAAQLAYTIIAHKFQNRLK